RLDRRRGLPPPPVAAPRPAVRRRPAPFQRRAVRTGRGPGRRVRGPAEHAGAPGSTRRAAPRAPPPVGLDVAAASNPVGTAAAPRATAGGSGFPGRTAATRLHRGPRL